ncbi:MAG: hypothetical protein GX057_06480 [Clostridiales bacterium]|nr:hypothetical protein [Clostridiales bacterium]HOA85560.1 hypothetical protein [Bacillota bacterium]
MKRLLTTLLFLLLLSGCMADDGRYLEYSRGAFAAIIEGRAGEFDFTAEVRVGPPLDTGDRNPPPRDIELTFLSPATLAGIRIARRDGRVSVYSGELTADGSYAAGWLAAAELLIPEGSVTAARHITEDGVKMTKLEMRLRDSSLLTIWIDRSGYPLRVVSDSGRQKTDLRIRAFTPRQ